MCSYLVTRIQGKFITQGVHRKRCEDMNVGTTVVRRNDVHQVIKSQYSSGWATRVQFLTGVK